MKFRHRRQFLQCAAGAAALPAMSQLAWAQPYPTRPVHIIVGLAPGGTTDILARLMGQWLSERLGQPFIIENRPGAAGNVATEAVVNMRPDGYSLLMVSSTNMINATLYDKLNYNFIRDITPVAAVARVPLVMEVHPSVPARTVPEFISYAKANPGKISMGSAGIGNSTHMAGELFKMMTGVDLIHVPYRGAGPALADVVGGHIQGMFDGVPASIENIKAEKVRALAVTTATRLEILPDVPTVGEFVPGYEASAVNGIGAPKDTPAEIIGTINAEINAALADAKLKSRFAAMGAFALPGSDADFGKMIVAETEKWARVVKFSHAKPE
jgi:tripartite-type tricarboxylate transporter receptor subunit TctC